MGLAIGLFFQIQFHFRVCDLRLSLVKAHAAVDEVDLAGGKHFLYPLDALEPYQFQRARCIADFRHQPPAPFFAHGAHADEPGRYLDELGLWGNVPDETDFCLIDVPVGEMFKQVFPGKDAQLFF